MTVCLLHSICLANLKVFRKNNADIDKSDEGEEFASNVASFNYPI